MLTVGSLFSGIGGIDLGLESTGGFRTIWFAEIDPYCSRVLAKHWPEVPNYGDVKNIGADAPAVDLLAAGFPCQPVSLAGKGLAQDDPRWLWPEVARIVGLLRPPWVLLENVPGLVRRGLGDVLRDLYLLGYDAEWGQLSAAQVGAPHRRRRVFLVAYPHGAELRLEPWRGSRTNGQGEALAGDDGAEESLANPHGTGWGTQGLFPSLHPPTSGEGEKCSVGGASESHPGWATEPDVGRVAYGVPSRVDRLTALGNAVVPQCAEVVGRMILEVT